MAKATGSNQYQSRQGRAAGPPVNLVAQASPPGLQPEITDLWDLPWITPVSLPGNRGTVHIWDNGPYSTGGGLLCGATSHQGSQPRPTRRPHIKDQICFGCADAFNETAREMGSAATYLAPAVCEQMIKASETFAREYLLSMPPTDQLIKLALRRSFSTLAQLHLVDLPACPPDVFEYLSQSQSAHVRLAVAGSTSCPPDILGKLACDPEPGVADTAMQNPAIPRHILAMAQLARGNQDQT